ncbi:MAG TPA: sugar transferase [Bacteroidales bacterium]|jgi:lipopolysaccharide/colanic/teichoic acid biosynthesis glycosyltransferase|nr:sugar transferase [Bacteroidales bacterium]
MTINGVYLIASIIVSFLGIIITLALISNSRLKNVLKETEKMVNSYDVSKIDFIEQPKKHLNALKRIMDVLSALIIIILWLPVYLICITLILLESNRKTSVFVAKSRIGKNGEKFKLYHFNTTHLNKNGVLEVSGIGQFMRITNLDQLPEFYNLLKGDISLVGRSPYVENPNYANAIKPEIRDILLKMRPGALTLWSVSSERFEFNLNKMISYDLYYIKHLSIKLDIKIAFKAIIYVFGNPARY